VILGAEGFISFRVGHLLKIRVESAGNVYFNYNNTLKKIHGNSMKKFTKKLSLTLENLIKRDNK
jgi:hypothetical protein